MVGPAPLSVVGMSVKAEEAEAYAAREAPPDLGRLVPVFGPGLGCCRREVGA